MGKKLSNEQIENIVKNNLDTNWKVIKIINHFVDLIDGYGYKYNLNIHGIKTNRKPYFVHKLNPYTIQNIKLWCKLNNKPFELLSITYENNKRNLLWKCLDINCGEEFKSTWNGIFSNNYGCPYCSGHQVGISNCLATKNPKLAKEWHPTKNKNLTPFDFTAMSDKDVWWQCSENLKHEWNISIKNRNKKKGTGCPYCSGNLPSEDYNLLVVNKELCKEWDYNKNEKRPEDYLPNSNQHVFWICKECGHN